MVAHYAALIRQLRKSSRTPSDVTSTTRSTSNGPLDA
jgi:hypothetical protein